MALFRRRVFVLGVIVIFTSCYVCYVMNLSMEVDHQKHNRDYAPPPPPPHKRSNSLPEILRGDAFEEGPFAHETVGDMDASEHMGGDLELSKGGPLLESQPYLSVRSAPSHEDQESTRIGLSSNEFGLSPSSTLSEFSPILFLIVTGSAFHRSRAEAVKQTWGKLACPEYLVFVSDENDEALPAFKVTEADPTNKDKGFTMKGWGESIPKFEFGFDVAIQAAEKARAKGRGIKWYYMAGDDTFVDIPQMIRFLDGYDSNEKHFIAECCTNGQSSTCEYNTPFDASSDIQFYSSCGGGGWIFSQGLIDAMISFSNNANKSPGTLIHETRAPFNTLLSH